MNVQCQSTVSTCMWSYKSRMQQTQEWNIPTNMLSGKMIINRSFT